MNKWKVSQRGVNKAWWKMFIVSHNYEIKSQTYKIKSQIYDRKTMNLIIMT